MSLCPICGKDANKKNVHLIPWFLIKDCITKNGSGKRDMELSFEIDPYQFTKMYAGRSILPEQIEGFGILNDLEKEINNPYSRDYLICSDCEDKFSRLEAIFALQFNEKYINNSLKEEHLTLNNNSVLFSPKYDYSLFELFVLSIFYRCSIGRLKGFMLNSKIEKQIGENFRIAFSVCDFVKVKPSDKIYYPYRFPVLASKFLKLENEDSTSGWIVILKSRFPYCIFTSKWNFYMYEREKHIISSNEHFFGLSDAISPTNVFMETANKSHVIVMEKGIGIRINNNICDFFLNKKSIGLKKNISSLYQKFFNSQPSGFILEYVLKNYFKYREEGKTEYQSFINAFLDLKRLDKN